MRLEIAGSEDIMSAGTASFIGGSQQVIGKGGFIEKPLRFEVIDYKKEFIDTIVDIFPGLRPAHDGASG